MMRNLPGLHRDHRAVQRQVHLLPLAAHVAVTQRRQNRQRLDHPRRVIGHRRPGRMRLRRAARHAHNPAHRLSQNVPPRPLRPGAACAECRRRYENDVRLRLAQLPIANAQPLQHVGTPVIDHHIARSRDLMHNPHRLRTLQIQRHALLAPIMHREIGTQALQLRVRRDRAARKLPRLAPLDLDHLRAHIRQNRRPPRPLNLLREIEDAHALHNLRHRSSSLRSGPARPGTRPRR